jgi:hypothetical protein
MANNKAKKLSGLLRNFWLNGLLVKKIWLIACILSFVIMWLFVLAGNLPLPVEVLAMNGWDWHHIPEIASSIFYGMWAGSFGFLSSKGFTRRDAIPFLFLFVLWIAAPRYPSDAVWVLQVAVVLPSFIGYLVFRIYRIDLVRSIVGKRFLKN